jgi:hypothetical protein
MAAPEDVIVDEPEALVVLLARVLARPEQRLSSGQWP